MALTYPVLWLAAMVVFLLLEFVTYQYVSIWFAVGCIGAFILSLFDLPFGGQVAAFFVLSVILLFATKPIVKRLMIQKPVATNADRIIGQTGIVTEEIKNTEAKGTIEVLGQAWTARSENNTAISAGQRVKIIRIEGVKAIVSETENEE